MNPKKFLSTLYSLLSTHKGQATLEFAIFFPLFALVIAMIIQFSWVLLAKQRVEMAAFRGALYAAKPGNPGGNSEDYIRENVVKKFFPAQQRPSVSLGDFEQKLAANDAIDYAELSVRADVRILGMFTIQPFRAMWEGIREASKARAGMVANRIREAIDAGEIRDNPDTWNTINKIKDCYDRYTGDTYSICAFHKIAYDPNVPFSKE